MKNRTTMNNLVLYKFIPFEGFRKTIEGWTLKCSTIYGVNDILENVPCFPKNKPSEINTNLQNSFTEAFFSFSHKMSVPAMWGHYAANATGVCMVFVLPCEKLTGRNGYRVYRNAPSYELGASNSSDDTTALLDLVYSDERAKYPYEDIETYPKPEQEKEVASRLTDLLIRKAACWQYENEIRLFDSFDNADSVVNDYLLYFWIMRYFAGVLVAPKCEVHKAVIKKLIETSYANIEKERPSLIYPLLKNGWIVQDARFARSTFSIVSDGLTDNMSYKDFCKLYFYPQK